MEVIEALVDGCPDDLLLDRIGEITSGARTLSAWTCVEDGNPGWRVDGPKGPTILCQHCQLKLGLKVRRHEA